MKTFSSLPPKYCIESRRSERRNMIIPAAKIQNAALKIAVATEKAVIKMRTKLYKATSGNILPKFMPIFFEDDSTSAESIIAAPTEASTRQIKLLELKALLDRIAAK